MVNPKNFMMEEYDARNPKIIKQGISMKLLVRDS